MSLVLAHKNLIKKIRYVAVYLRKSRGTGVIEIDLEKHIKKIKEYCEKFGWTYVLYEEVASGSDITHRPQIQKLLKHVNEGMYDAVFVFDIDRLSRGGSADQDRIFSALRNTNTLLVTANPFKIYNLNDESDDMIIDVFGFVGKMEYKQIRKRMTAGKKIGVQLGRWVYGDPPYGYDYDRKSKKLVINEEEAVIFREAVEKYLNGYSTVDIACDFNRRKIPSPKGDVWYATSISRLFKSPVYRGHIVGNKTEGNNTRTRTETSKPFRKLPENEWIMCHNAHKALLTEEEYKQIMKILKSRGGKCYANEINTFTSLVKCAYCGNTMYHKNDRGQERLSKCSCGNHGGSTEVISVAIYESTIQLREKLKQIKVEEVDAQKEKQLLKQIQSLEKDYEKQNLAIEKIEEAFEAGFYDVKKAQRKTQEREQEKWRLEKEIKKLRKQLTSVNSISNKERISKIDKFIKDIKKNNNPEQKNAIYKSLISEIIWDKKDNNKVVITINFL